MRTLLLASLVTAAVLLQASCVQPSHTGAQTTSEQEASLAITQVSQTCVDAWNHGDLNAYLAAYSDDVVVVYQTGPERGIDLLEARLRQAQGWNGQRPSNLASVGHSEVVLIDAAHALQTAEIIIQEPNGEVHLWVTSLLERTDSGWLVVHEQSF